MTGLAGQSIGGLSHQNRKAMQYTKEDMELCASGLN